MPACILRLARTNSTASRMSKNKTSPKPSALALARWTVLLMGWVWLGAQGQRVGWSLASGVVPVALWWAMRLVFTNLHISHYLPRSAPWVLGTLTALGTMAVAMFPSLGTGALLALACVWAAWAVLLDSPDASSRCKGRWAGWPPLLAAALCALATAGPVFAPLSHTAVGLFLLVAAWLGRDVTRKAPQLASHYGQPTGVIPTAAMGLMMGTLWLGSDWCRAAGLSNAEVVVLHLGLMAALPGLTRLDLIPRCLSPLQSQRISLILVFAGSVVLLSGSQAIHGLIGMGLLFLAWAMHSGRYGAVANLGRRWSVLGGPILLLMVGCLSPLWGPMALRWAYGMLGGMALLALAMTGRYSRPNQSLQFQWRDAL
jgi:hypothetical protein